MFKKPLMYVRDTVVFPCVGDISLLIGREDSIKAIDLALDKFDSKICIITQKKGENERPIDDEVFPVGTICKIEKCLKFSDGSRKILIKGIQAFNLKSITYENETRLVKGEAFEWDESGSNIDQEVKDEVLNLLKKYNPLWETGEGKDKFDTYFTSASRLDDFVLKTSHLIASPYDGVQFKSEMDKIRREVDYWKEIGSEQIEEMNTRIGKRVKLLTALPSLDKLDVIKEILTSET